MRRTNIYLTEVQQEGFRRLTAATGLSMAALVRSAVNHMLANPGRFHELQAAKPAKRARAAESPKRAVAKKAPAKVART